MNLQKLMRSASALALAFAMPVLAEKVTVTVNNVASGEGLIRGSLCSDPSKFPSTDCRYKVDVPAVPGSVDLVFENVAPGTYAFTVWHDLNSDGKTQLPNEGFAFGNNAPVPPTFDSASIRVSNDTTAAVTLFYMARPTNASVGEPGAAALPGTVKTDVREKSLYGALYAPPAARNLPAIIAIGGSEGGLDLASAVAKSFAQHGYVVLALAYWRAPGLPQSLESVRLEYFKQAVDWLKTRTEVDPARVGILGLSRGAEGALLVASHYADIKAVVAVAPSSHLWPSSNMSLVPTGSGASQIPRQPAWTLGGRPLPFLTPKALADDSGPARNLAPYERALSETPADSDSEIPVDRINGPVLLLSGEQDGIWPAGAMAERIVARLKAARFLYSFSHLQYPGAGHLVFLGDPASLDSSKIAPLERAMGGTDSGNLAARRDSWTRCLAFFDNALTRSK